MFKTRNATYIHSSLLRPKMQKAYFAKIGEIPFGGIDFLVRSVGVSNGSMSIEGTSIPHSTTLTISGSRDDK